MHMHLYPLAPVPRVRIDDVLNDAQSKSQKLSRVMVTLVHDGRRLSAEVTGTRCSFARRVPRSQDMECLARFTLRR